MFHTGIINVFEITNTSGMILKSPNMNNNNFSSNSSLIPWNLQQQIISELSHQGSGSKNCHFEESIFSPCKIARWPIPVPHLHKCLTITCGFEEALSLNFVFLLVVKLVECESVWIRWLCEFGITDAHMYRDRFSSDWFPPKSENSKAP